MTKACGKTRYPTSHRADVALTRITRRTTKNDHRPQRAYLCNRCNGWHLTSQTGPST